MNESNEMSEVTVGDTPIDRGQSNQENIATEHLQESPAFEIISGKIYKTEKGNEYIVNYIARESGNIEDLFAVYRKISSVAEVQSTADVQANQDNVPKQSWIKKTSDFKSVEDFDEDEETEDANLTEIKMAPPEFAESTKSTESVESMDEVSIGQEYQHFKTKDHYIIKDLACNRKNPKEKFVVYEGQYDSQEFGNHPLWVREYEDFTGMKVFKESEVDENGKQKPPVKRFTLIS